MSYLNKTERKEMILSQAATLTLECGFKELSIRKVAKYANISVGQIHHHFSSIQIFKSCIFSYLTKELAHKEALYLKNKSYLDKIYIQIGLTEIKELSKYIKLWNEFAILMEDDSHLQQAYSESMRLWHRLILQTLEDGINKNIFTPQSNLEELAWYLISLGCGLEILTDITSLTHIKEFMKQQVKIILE